MNATKTISVLVLAAATAWSQGTTTKPAAKPAAPAKTGVKPASQTPPASAPKASVAKTAPATKSKSPVAATAAPKKPVVKTAAAPKTPKAKTAPAAAKSIAPVKPLGKRDPFVSVIVARSDSSAACTGGKRCLIVDQLALRGIVRTPTKWIALVENPARKTYYLYENDPIFNAVVVRITGDSVIFRESVMDALGHSTEREVVKRVNAPAI